MNRKFEKPPSDRVIYHYCNTDALLSILESRKLYFTHAAFLNDTSEIRHGIEICQALLSDCLNAIPDDPVISNIKLYLEDIERWQYYVCCFSECEDKLSQWRAYANDGDGFAIGFHTHDFRTNHDRQFEGRFNKVEYTSDILKSKLEVLLDKYATQKHKSSSSKTQDPNDLSYKLTAECVGNMLINESVFIKSPGFAEEQEWRAVRCHQECATAEGQESSYLFKMVQELQQECDARRMVRSGRFGLTPYIEIEFRPESIKKIVCGPRTAKSLTEKALDVLKKKYDLRYDVTRSTATYR